MLVGVISDSHDRLPAIDRALAPFKKRGVEAIVDTERPSAQICELDLP